MIIVSGCSWACGEWDRGDRTDQLLFPGLEYNFGQDGYDCINLGIPSGSNLSVANKVNGYLLRNPDIEVTKIFIFQTEWSRDKKIIFEEDYENLRHATDLQNIFIARFYSQLSIMAQQYKTKVYLIGGVSDTLWLDNMEEHYPGVQILCQSLVNFLLENNHRIDKPVFDWYGSESVELIKKIKSLLPDNERENLLKMVDQSIERESIVFSHPEYFWPDGCHPNRHAYKKLYDLIMKKVDFSTNDVNITV